MTSWMVSEGGVRAILLDDKFWEDLVAALRLMTPIVKLLRLCDGEVGAMGKIYDKMFLLTEKAAKSNASFAPKVKQLIESRWEYLHSFMHGAGYALDPEFLESTGSWDQAISNGVHEIIERLCLRECILENKGKYDEPLKSITTDSDEVVQKVADCELELAKYKQEAARGCLHEKECAAERKAHGAGCVVGPVLQAPADPLEGRLECASASHLRFSGRAQLVSLRPD